MKIIGKAGRNFIIELDEHEVANLLGHYYADSESKVSELKPGDVIQVSNMVSQLRSLRSKANEIRTAQKMLSTASEILNLVDPLVLLDVVGEEVKSQ